MGNYHASRVVPTLLVSIAAMLAAMITPHLSHDWEAGRREQVAARLRLFVKLFGLATLAGIVAVAAAAPLLFNVALRGKFAGRADRPALDVALLRLVRPVADLAELSALRRKGPVCERHAAGRAAAERRLEPRPAAAAGPARCRAGHGRRQRLVAGAALLDQPPPGLPAGRGHTARPGAAAAGLLAGLGGRAGVLAVAAEAVFGNRLFSPEEKRQLADRAADYARRLRLDRRWGWGIGD